MKYFHIGAMADSFRLPAKEALLKVKEVGAEGYQIYASNGSFAPDNLDKKQRAEFKKYSDDLGLTISALCGDLGRGFYNREANKELVEKSKKILQLAADLDTHVVTTHIGVVPENMNGERFEIMHDACLELAKAADDIGVKFAVETGPETSLTLKRFLDTLNSRGVSVNLDPANLVMVTGDDPVQAVYNLKDYIVHTHAKDGKMLTKGDPEIIYGLKPAPAGGIPAPFVEVPLGEGSVDFPKYLAALRDIGFKGFLTIEREVGDDPAKDIAMAVGFLRKTVEGLD
ncbi:MAG: sugar phosphate isomerase/epimerase [Clostridia bacterium]|nr:sugar phosphate isomerase/epimerase [Clostridia bacterium]